MIYRNLLGERVSMLGFGAMRLPVGEDGEINLPLATEMIERALASGVNYFDTAYPYHGGKSEIVLGEILSRYPRGSFFLANKFPGHQLMKRYDPAAIFEEQLKKCGVEYFDFYLLHNVYERSMGVYTDPELGILDYFLEQKKNGRIRHLGFSTHALTDGLREFLDLAGEHMEFCQIQMNYLDYTLQDAKGKYELLTERGIPVIVMEPVRGGKLASLDEKYVRLLDREAPGASAASFAFRYLMDFDNISVVLSGMSNMEQVLDNIATFNTLNPLSDSEKEILSGVAYDMMNSVPCTSCRYCVEGCPKNIVIPRLFACMNEKNKWKNWNSGYYYGIFTKDRGKASDCIGCGQCEEVCPQKLPIRELLKTVAEQFEKNNND